MPDTRYYYDANARLTSIWYPSGARTIYNYDELGNRTAAYDVPECCSPRFFILEKTSDFTADDGPGAYYRIYGDVTVSMPASTADGGLRKFKVLEGTATFAFTDSDTINHANGVSNQTLQLTSRSGCAELLSVSGGFDET